jgi:hypothetical protein
VFLLDADHAAPPFIITCDVGHAFEIFADFTGTGRAYTQFPDRNGFRIHLEDLRSEATRKLLARIWTDPLGLDPSREQARVTREVAARLAEVSKALEQRGENAEDVAHFLMRCLFTMFAEDVGLLPENSFKALLEKSVKDPAHFPHRLKALWQDMDHGSEFSSAVEDRVRHFNGGLFRSTRVFELKRDEIAELLAAARHRWTEVDPAIFGTLLEQALEPKERKKLGAHYTPRAYVQRLVEVTVMEPLRADWQKALIKAEAAKEEGADAKAIDIVRGFHHQLCTTRVLDPACGTGNFLYVSLELMKKLEGEVLETLARLGDVERLGLEGETVDPHQFLGLELNPRAAAIAELVVWIGYLQQHYRTHSGHPAEPILRAFKNINFGRRDGYDAVLTWDGYPLPKVVLRDGKRVETFPNARRPEWPEAEFIVGNPPFIGKGAAMRSALGDAYVDVLWKAHAQMNESADLVMCWWNHAADLLRSGKVLRRFGLVTTNSIVQMFNRRILDKHLKATPPISIVFAIPDHPWTKATKDAAAVRIAMTVASRGKGPGELLRATREKGLSTDDPAVDFSTVRGTINPDLSIGANVGNGRALLANEGISWNGVMLAARGFELDPPQARRLSRSDDGSSKAIKPFCHGGDLVGSPRSRFVIDFHGLTRDQARVSAPAAYAHILATVKPQRDMSRDQNFRQRWWVFGRTRPELRTALSKIKRYVATTETSKHRIFQFLPRRVMPDHMIIAIASDDAMYLAVLSSRPHVAWSLRAGGTLEDRPRYNKARTFDPFPFPDPPPALRRKLSDAGEELDALRKQVLAEHPDLTLTGLYNVLEKLRKGEPLKPRDEDIKNRGLVLILKELHDTIDRLTAEAYGWPADLPDERILERLVALNAERAREEAAGHVRWLRPDYQIPRFAKGVEGRTKDMDFGDRVVAIDRGRPLFPKDRYEQPLAIEAVLAAAARPMDAAEISRAFGNGGRRIEQSVALRLTTLARYGRVTALPGGKFAAQNALALQRAA